MPDHQRAPVAAIGFIALAWLMFRVLADGSSTAEGMLKIVLWVIPSVLVVGGIGGFSFKGIITALGLRGSPTGGVLFGMVATLPIAVLAAIRISQNVDLLYGVSFQVARLIRGWDAVLGNVVFGPFAEEVLFRGFLIYALARVGRWPAGLVIATSGALFGLAHFGNAGDLWQLLPGQALGGAVFAWIAIRRGTIWPAIGFHACLNLWWDFFPTQAQLGTVPSMLLALLSVLALRWLSARRRVESAGPIGATDLTT